ncbi:hypothetical protein [Roseateles oligotrophus]|uniref:TonB-dependent receptor n=1 Tax=Roseateles oligotrophus TaxID=1769250 RepID=A0ABT2YI98_9BURK|nr:hypothetical protein [Roseateles oligotrophus]MCV2369782.1 hypothetical protein [Roseateles oligotrophus]
MKLACLAIYCLMLAAGVGPVFAQTSEDQELAQAYGDAATVSVASAFTTEDIRALGFSDLRDVLGQVPGLNVSGRHSPFMAKIAAPE